MDNNNNNNKPNGKEVHKVQLPKNGKNDDKTQPVNRIKKNQERERENEIHSTGPRKIPINVNKKSNNPHRSSQKGQVIKLGDRENKIHTAPPVVKKASSAVDNPNPIPPSSNTQKETGEVYTTPPSWGPAKGSTTDKENFKVSPNTGKLLLVISAVLFIAWAVTFFYYKIGGNIHMLLAFAVICAFISLLGKKNNVK